MIINCISNIEELSFTNYSLGMKKPHFAAAGLVYVLLVVIVFAVTIVNLDDSAFYAEYNRYSNYIHTKVSSYMKSRLAASKAVCDNLFFEQWLQNGASQNELLEFVERQKGFVECASIDLITVESETGYNNIDKVVFQVEPDNPRDQWYYDFLSLEKESNTELYYHSIDGTLYVYYNRKINASNGDFIAVAGFLFQYDQILESITLPGIENFEVYFTNMQDQVVIHPDQSKINDVIIYDYFGKLQDASHIAPANNGHSIEGSYAESGSYTTVSLVPDLNLKLIVHHNKTLLKPHISALESGIAFLLVLLVTAGFVFYVNRRCLKSFERED